LHCPFIPARPNFRKWLAVGDAASTYDPISSQGIYKALRNGLEAAKAIASYLHGDSQGLKEYESAITSQFDNYLTYRNYFYQMERRWLASPFWQQRQERTSTAARN